MFDKLPETVAMSEPWALFHAHIQYSKGFVPREDYPDLIKGLLRLQFKAMRRVSLTFSLLKRTRV